MVEKQKEEEFKMTNIVNRDAKYLRKSKKDREIVGEEKELAIRNNAYLRKSNNEILYEKLMKRRSFRESTPMTRELKFKRALQRRGI